jgi:PPOX class probable FMN-dependent enzyme
MKPLSLNDVEALYGEAKPTTRLKLLKKLERYSIQFIGLSPFCVISSAGPDGRQDVSPRGGAPGFVRVADETTLLLPDRPGNNLLDSLKNLTAGGGRVGMLFLIPGFNETLRVNGTAEVLYDAVLCADYAEFGKPARSVMKIAVDEVFFQCGKALMRSALWEAGAQVDRSVMPSISQMVTEQAGIDRVPETQAQMVARYKDTL